MDIATYILNTWIQLLGNVHKLYQLYVGGLVLPTPLLSAIVSNWLTPFPPTISDCQQLAFPIPPTVSVCQHIENLLFPLCQQCQHLAKLDPRF